MSAEQLEAIIAALQAGASKARFAVLRSQTHHPL